MKNHPDRVQGDEAKKAATVKFSEISAAYELLTTKGDVGASHPSFAGGGAAASYPDSRSYPPRNGYGRNGFQQTPFMDPFSMGMDPFGFGTFGGFEFSDPFELFRRTFDDAGQDDSIFGSNASMGGFPSMFGGANLPMGTTTFTSSSYSYGSSGANGGGACRMVSTTTTMVNGKTVTRREETVINPDGTKTTTIDLTGDEDEDRPIPAIQAETKNGHKKHRISSHVDTPPTKAKAQIKNGSSKENLIPKTQYTHRTGYKTFNPDSPVNYEKHTPAAPPRSKKTRGWRRS